MDIIQAIAKAKQRKRKTKYYDYRKAAKLLIKNNVKKAALGMKEDWDWTADEITIAKLKKFRNKRTKICGINGSIWATPSIEIDGAMLPCWTH